jgi:hypothetical protein
MKKEGVKISYIKSFKEYIFVTSPGKAYKFPIFVESYTTTERGGAGGYICRDTRLVIGLSLTQ